MDTRLFADTPASKMSSESEVNDIAPNFTTYYSGSKAIVSSLDYSLKFPAYRFVNRTDARIALMWLNFSGEAIHFGTVGPNENRE